MGRLMLARVTGCSRFPTIKSALTFKPQDLPDSIDYLVEEAADNTSSLSLSHPLNLGVRLQPNQFCLGLYNPPTNVRTPGGHEPWVFDSGRMPRFLSHFIGGSAEGGC